MNPRLQLMLAIQRAEAAGFTHFAAALVQLLRRADSPCSAPGAGRPACAVAGEIGGQTTGGRTS